MLRSATTERRLAAALEPVQVLYWTYAVRLLFSIGVFGSSLLIQDLTQSHLIGLFSPQYRVATLGLSAATLLTPLAYWYSHRRRLKLGVVFIYAQAMLDVLLVNGIVHLTGGSNSYFTFLFIPLAAVYALILPLVPAVLIALSSGLIYLVATLLAFPGQVSVWGLQLQVAIFTMVAVLASLLGALLLQVRVRLRSVEGELRRLQLDTADVLRIIPSGVLTVDEDWRLVYMNLAAAELLQIDVDPWLGREIKSLLEARSVGMAIALQETLDTSRRVRSREVEILPPLLHDDTFLSADPTGLDVVSAGRDPVPVAVSTSSLQGAGIGSSYVVLIQDLRPSRQLEDLRLRTGRLQAVAELSASLAHELRNPIASVRSAVEQLSSRVHASESDKVLGRLITRESDRLSRILGDFSDFARVDVASRQLIDVDRLTREVVETVRQHPGAEGRAIFDRQVAADLGGLWGDAELLHRALLNLVLNSVQVGDPSENVRIQIIADALRPDLVPNEMSLGVPVRIRVIDDGPGIDSEDLPRIFDPFFTRRKGGSGLGLSVAHRAVQAHGGALIASSKPGQGATFAIVLPRRGRLLLPLQGVDDRRDMNIDSDLLIPERG
ncbi:MAG: PAS domain-containing protein [Gemmatimonadales bacterium]|nr:MAG: PAS domain-containing protein [Gemmatimonadales bacterium]